MRPLPVHSTLRAIKREMVEALCRNYGQRESESIATELFFHYLQWKRSDIILRNEEVLSATTIDLLTKAMEKLEAGIPLQYVTGTTYFYGMEFQVSPAVLIPRPETEELARMIVRENQGITSFLDIGTGSGCIALAIARNISGSIVSAMDISAEALSVAASNALHHHLDIHFFQGDILQFVPTERYEVIVSNPPYIAKSERMQMHSRVVEHEPSAALFVSDDDPLLFYRRIIALIPQVLTPNGKIYFEIHEEKKDALAAMTESFGYRNFIFKKDMQGRNRIMKIMVE